MKLYIISNRLPVKATCDDKSFVFSRSEGGLTTGLDSLQTPYEKHWIGWPGICVELEKDKNEIASKLEGMNFHPIFLSQTQITNYYEGYSNSTIWPLCHYFFVYTKYKKSYWQSYQEVNRIFCDKICSVVEPGDKVWIQDYQLMLLPGMLRKACPNLSIGYFHHIPFPSYELFRILPERAQILEGLLGADFIAFHTHDYMRHFISAAERVLRVDFSLDEVQYDNRIIRVDALPMGINYELYHEATMQPEVRKAIDRKREFFGDHKLILSVDRLDYSKGILHRLWGFSSFLQHHPEYHGKVTLAMVIVPSRDHVGSYAELKTRIDEEIGSINGRYSTMDWAPISYFYHGFPLEELIAMYYVADIALVTPLRDGMNLVAKEYVATKNNNPGVLILSEMAGVSVELPDALHINPNDTEQIEKAIGRALTMSEEEQKSRMQRMQAIVSTKTVNKWANDFVSGLDDTFDKNQKLRGKVISKKTTEEIKQNYCKSSKRLILLDYDGTLAPIKLRPEEAAPTSPVIDLLLELANDPAYKVVIISGRDHVTLEKWLGNTPVSFAAEHGGFYKENGLWHKNGEIQPDWNATGVLSIIQMFTHKTPHSHYEMKETALAWHYRESDSWLGTMRAQQLANALVPICIKYSLQIIQGSKVVEIKSSNHNKGSEVRRLLEKERYDFIIAIGDDTTDDDMFKALPKASITVKVGNISGAAKYNLPEQSMVLPFIHSILEEQNSIRRNSIKRRFGLVFNFVKKSLKIN